MDNLIILALLLGLGAAFWLATRKQSSPEREDEDEPPRDAPRPSPLGAAIAAGNDQEVRALLDGGADPNGPVFGDLPALFFAAHHGRAALIAPLIEAGAAIDFCLPTIGSALGPAVIKRDRATVEALLDAGVSPSLCSDGGAHPLHYAALKGDRELLELLINRGADIHAPNFQGGTALRSAAEEGHLPIVKLLLEKGADPSPLDEFEKRPIDYARENKHADVVALLENAPRPPSLKRDFPYYNPMALMLPPRNDATLQAVIMSLEQKDPITACGASSLEAPTMISAAKAVLGSDFSVAFGTHDVPDPRMPTREVEYLLWRYDAPNEASLAVEHPPEAIREAVAGIAEFPYRLSSWSRVAARAAAKLRAENMGEVIAAMVHPSPGPPYVAAWDWYFRTQVAAALIASHLGNEPWADSPRRRALEDVLDGPTDWSNTAAIIALLDVALRDEAARPLVIDALARTARREVNPPIFQHAIQPAARALLEIPGLDAELAREMRSLATST